MFPNSTAFANFRANIKALMAYNNISISELADLLQVSQPVVSEVLSARKGCTFERAEDWARLFGLEVSHVTRGTDPKQGEVCPMNLILPELRKTVTQRRALKVRGKPKKDAAKT